MDCFTLKFWKKIHRLTFKWFKLIIRTSNYLIFIIIFPQVNKPKISFKKTQSEKNRNVFQFFHRFSFLFFSHSLFTLTGYWKKNNKIHFTSHHRHFLHNIVVGRHATYFFYVHMFFIFTEKKEENFLNGKIKLNIGLNVKKVSVQENGFKNSASNLTSFKTVMTTAVVSSAFTPKKKISFNKTFFSPLIHRLENSSSLTNYSTHSVSNAISELIIISHAMAGLPRDIKRQSRKKIYSDCYCRDCCVCVCVCGWWGN